METNEGKQQNAKPEQANEKANPWFSARERWPSIGMSVKFVSDIGLTHLGYPVAVARPGEHRNMARTPGAILLVSDDTEHPEYFTEKQVEKWQETNERVPKKRLVGQTYPDTLEHAGRLTPMFLTYLYRRITEKLAERKGKLDVRVYETYHYTDAEGRHMWETGMYVSSPASGGMSIMFSEHETTSVMKVEYQYSGAPAAKEYDYKLLPKACEEICRFILGDEKH